MKAVLLKIFFIAIIAINLIGVISKNSDKYFKFDYWQRYPSLEYLYKNSQYVTKTPVGWLPDEVIYSYNGPALIKGGSPLLIIPDSPPLGKYLIGLSALFFNNENLVILLCGLLSLIGLFFLSKQILGNTLLALFPCLLISFEPLFLNQFVFVPLLDLFQLIFLLPCFYFFNKGLINPKRSLFFFFISTIFIGCFISTKFYITGLTIIASFIIVLILHKKVKPIIDFLITLPNALFVLMLSYFRIFLDGENVRRFFGAQKWIFMYHQSQLVLPFSIWPLILFNKWYVWWGDIPILSDPQWRLTWPIIFITSLITIICYFFGKIPKKSEFESIAVWSICYLLFFSFGHITARYLIIYLPILYLVTIFGLKNLYERNF